MEATIGIALSEDRRIDGDSIGGGFRDALIAWGGPGADVSACIQCGTCTASCEAMEFMEHGPRQLIRLVKFGFAEEALGSKDLWACTGCHLCTTRCPWGVRVSEVMDALKGLAIGRGIQNDSVVYHQAYMRSLGHHGILSEAELVMDYAVKTGPLRELKRQRRLGLKLLLKRKTKVLKRNLRGLKAFKGMAKAINGSVQR